LAEARQRADRLLVEHGLFKSRVKASAAIAAALVSTNDVTVRKAAEEISVEAMFRASAAHYYVSRVKLIAALGYFGFDPTAKACLDIGATIGGFTQVLLERGARLDDAVDAGRGQFYGTLRA
jgi:23S rRNA (cytidine1920-2'-O)/16S rRNA (cytidine1409-2'-O)-methyltransferase